MKRIFWVLLLVPVLLISCHYLHRERVRGNGNIKSETRSTGVFSSVDISGNIDLYIKQDSSRSVKVEADENLMEYIVIKTENDRLIIEPKKGYNLSGTKSIKVYVSSPVFKKLEASGSCDIRSENKIESAEKIDIDLAGSSDVSIELKAPAVEAELSGSGSIALSGETKDLTVSGAGSTDIKCMQLMAENVSVDISGSGEAEVFASVKLDVSVSGSGDIKYKGNAALTKSISGSGSVTKLE